MPEAVTASRSPAVLPDDSSSFEPVCRATASAPPPADAWSSPSSVETHAPVPATDLYLAPPPSAESARSPEALHREVQRQAAERSRDAKTVATALAPGLARLASRFDEPGAVRLKDLRWSAFKDALDEPDMAAVLSRLPRAEVKPLLRDALAKAWPDCRAADVDAAVATFARAIDEHLEASSAFKLRDAIVSTLRKTASDLEALAGDAATLNALGPQLEALKHGTPEEKAEFKRLADGLGLDVPDELKRFDAASLAGRLTARAKLLREEATKSSNVGADRIFMEVAAHQFDGAFMERAGIAPDSWTGRSIASALERGEDEAHRLHLLKGATAVAMTVATGGLGGTAVLATITAASMGSLSLAEARAKVHQAEAGEAAGTMAPGATDIAKRNERAAQVGVAVSTALPAVMSLAGHHAFETIAEAVAEHVAFSEQAVALGTHAIAEGLCEAAIQTAETLAHVSNHGQGSLNVAQRIHVMTGRAALARLPSREREKLNARLDKSLEQAGVPPGAARRAVMALFLAHQGSALQGLDAPAIAARFDQFLAASR